MGTRKAQSCHEWTHDFHSGNYEREQGTEVCSRLSMRATFSSGVRVNKPPPPVHARYRLQRVQHLLGFGGQIARKLLKLAELQHVRLAVFHARRKLLAAGAARSACVA